MLLAAFICMVVISLALGTLYTLYGYEKKVVNVAVKLSAILSCGLIAIVCANLTSAVGGFSLFIIVATLLLIVSEAFNFLDEENNALFYYLKSLFPALAYVCIMVAGIFKSNFNYFSILFAIFLCGGLFCLSFAFAKEKRSINYWISKAILFLAVALFLGQGFTMIASSTKLLVSLFYLSGGVLTTASQIVKIFKDDENKILKIILNALTILGLILTCSSIFFI